VELLARDSSVPLMKLPEGEYSPRKALGWEAVKDSYLEVVEPTMYKVSWVAEVAIPVPWHSSQLMEVT